MQRMHEVGALFFLYAFPFPSIFRTPPFQKRTCYEQPSLLELMCYSVSLQINKGALKALAPKSLKPAGVQRPAQSCPSGQKAKTQPESGAVGWSRAAICETPCCYAVGW